MGKHRYRRSHSNQIQGRADERTVQDVHPEDSAAPECEIASGDEDNSDPKPRFLSPIAWLIWLFDNHNGTVTAFATIAIAVLTFFLAREANIEGQIMANQLADSETDERAYLLPEYSTTDPLTPGPGEAAKIRITYGLKNYGKTPATLRFSRVIWAKNTALLPPEKAFPTETEEPFAFPPIAAGESSVPVQLAIGFPADVIPQVTSGRSKIYIFAHYAYDDIFGKDHDCKRAYLIDIQRFHVTMTGGDPYNNCT